MSDTVLSTSHAFSFHPLLQCYEITPGWPNKDADWRKREKTKGKNYFFIIASTLRNIFFILTLRSQCHFSEPVPNGPICNGGPGLTKDPAAPLHGTHGGPGLQAAASPWWWDLHEGECHCLCLHCMAALLGLAGLMKDMGDLLARTRDVMLIRNKEGLQSGPSRSHQQALLLEALSCKMAGTFSHPR